MKKPTAYTIITIGLLALALTIWGEIININPFHILIFIILWDFGLRLINQIGKH